MVSNPSQSLATHATFKWTNIISLLLNCVPLFQMSCSSAFSWKKMAEETEEQSFTLPFLGPGVCQFLGADNLYLWSMCFLQISAAKFLQTAAQCLFIVDLNEVGQSQSGLSLTHEGSFKNCLSHKEQLGNQQGQLVFFKTFLKGLFIIQRV